MLSSLIAAVLIVVGCSKEQPAHTPVARLDNETLTLESIRADLDTTKELSQFQIQQYVQRWLRDEILYQEAIAQGLDKSEDVERRVAEVRRQLVINELLKKEVYSIQPGDIPFITVQEYYEKNKKDFLLQHDVVLLSYVLFKNRDVATEFRNTVVKGTPWNVALQQLSTTPDVRIDSMYFSQATLIPPELWRVATTIKEREVSFPISTTDGFYILCVWKYSKQGQQADLPYVENKIRARLVIEQRKMVYDSLVTALRKKHTIHIYTSGSDSLTL
ncbi:MAG: peptidyl-prolyl cis-trans isomerase [Bacteroidetes bacterium]|nr:peptidyl-prolyl cis-trans isomerase [Bacteroidota bacterium]